MQRSGVYVKQTTGYRAFIPTPLPPKSAVKIEGELQNLLSRADMALARLDGDAFKKVLHQAVALLKGEGRPLGNVIYFMPPYVVEEEDIEKMIRVAFESINQYFRA